MKRDKWNIKFDWVQSGETWIQQDRNEQFSDSRFISINDIYFKNQKYLSGVSYTYINKLEDVYKRDFLTGDGYSLYNMYNEYDIVDRVMKNIQIVDVASTSNVDITKQWRKINNIDLKPNQLILLNNQDSEFENDVYKVTQQYYLQNASFISNREKSDRFSVSVKMGTYKDKQFFLINNGEEFPTTGEPKHFIEGNSFILKHIIKYNLYNTSSNSAVTSKIIFTDYDIARKQLPINSILYNDVNFSVPLSVSAQTDYFQIHHHHDSFVMRTGTTNDNTVTGYTSQITNAPKYNTISNTILDVPTSHPTTIYLTGGTGLSWLSGFSLNVFNSDVNYFYATIISYNSDNGEFILDSISNTGTGTTISFWKLISTTVIEQGTMIKNISPFVANVGDYVSINIMTGSTTYLSMNTHIKQSASNYIVLENEIPNRLLRYLDYGEFIINNYNIVEGENGANWLTAISQLNNTPYSKFFNVSYTLDSGLYNIVISPKEYKYDKYFDYNDLTFKCVDGGVSSSFSSLYNYITYNLYTRLNLVNPAVFTSGFLFHNTQSFTSSYFSYTYTDDSRIKLSFTDSGNTAYFREYTYAYLNSDSTKKVMIWKIEGCDIYLDKPASWPTATAVNAITNIDGLFNISQILQEVYINIDYDWYISKKDNIRRKICSAYAILLTENVDFRRNVTGILFENEFNEFTLKLYDFDTDNQLDFKMVELMRLGADRKTRIPVPINKEGLVQRDTFSYYWNILDDGLTYTGTTAETYLSTNNTDEIFDGGFDVVLGGPSDPPLLFNIVDGNDS